MRGAGGMAAGRDGGRLGRSRYGLRAALATILLLPPAVPPSRPPAPLDLLILHGTLYDGTGAPPRIVDVGIRGDRIAFVGDARAEGLTAIRTIDATAKIVAPGFIDPHTHVGDDLVGAKTRGLIPFLLQGVTTVVIGNDGAGPSDVAGAIRRLSGGIGVNAAFLVGHGTIRSEVVGMADRAPTVVELERMRALVAKGMVEGAFGLSTGLYYAPASYAATDEVIELAKVASSFGGYYDSHIRDESSYTIGLLGAIDEAIRIGREAKIPVHIAHIKALGVDVWGQGDVVVSKVLAARAGGLVVTADQYPYSASSTGLGAALLPRWAEAGGRDSLLRRLNDPTTAARVKKEMGDNLRRRGGAESILLLDGRYRGKRLPAIAAETKLDSLDAAIAIIRQGDAGIASFNMKDSDIDQFMAQSWVVTGSDGSAGHPRKYGTFPRKLRRYALDRGVISLAQAIHSSSGATAAIVGLPSRGTIAVGSYADVIVFDSTTVGDRSTYEQPEALSTGMALVTVNGRVVIDRGRPTGVLAGRALHRINR